MAISYCKADSMVAKAGSGNSFEWEAKPSRFSPSLLEEVHPETARRSLARSTSKRRLDMINGGVCPPKKE